jgi:hypothetical protein
LICMVVAGGDVLDATRKIAERGQIWGNRTLRPGRAYRKPACATRSAMPGTHRPTTTPTRSAAARAIRSRKAMKASPSR